MKSPDILSVIIASIYLLTYTILLGNPDTRSIALLMLALSPVVVVCMVLIVLIKGKYSNSELNESEYGYSDKPAHSGEVPD